MKRTKKIIIALGVVFTLSIPITVSLVVAGGGGILPPACSIFLK